MSKGPALDFNTQVKMYVRLDASFRIIVDYNNWADQLITRLDVKIGNEQYAVAVASSHPIEPQSGDKILPHDDLITPKDGIIDCINLKVNKTDLVRALKELIQDIEDGDK